MFTVTVASNPAGTPVSGSTNTFDYQILSSVTLTCMVMTSDGSTLTVTNYQWNTTGCYTNTAHSGGNPTCFPTGQTAQSVTENDLTAEDAGIITCTVTIGGVDYTSEPLILRISGNIAHNYYIEYLRGKTFTVVCLNYCNFKFSILCTESFEHPPKY